MYLRVLRVSRKRMLNHEGEYWVCGFGMFFLEQSQKTGFSCYSALKFHIPGQRVLAELRLENYAVIDNLAVEFAAGLNLLTGETGAGKYILSDALGLLLGDKASA